MLGYLVSSAMNVVFVVIGTNAPQIGHQHGTAAKSQVAHSISFYADLFKQTTGLSWPEVQKTALQFKPTIAQKWPEYLKEMQGMSFPFFNIHRPGADVADVV